MGTARIKERTRTSKTARFPGRCLSTRRRTPDHCGGRRLLRPSAHTQAKYHQPHRSGGGANLHWAVVQETRRGLWSAVSRLAVDFRRTDDEGPYAAGGGRLNTRKWTENRQKGQKERGDGKDALEGKNLGVSWRGEKEGTRTITDRLTNRNLNIGTESRVQIADALGKELHHPKMSKLWYPSPIAYSSWREGKEGDQNHHGREYK